MIGMSQRVKNREASKREPGRKSLKRGLFHKRRYRRSVPSILVRQVEVALEAMRVANQVLSSEREAQASREKMRSIEHRGDDARIDLAERVNDALSVPLEREDLIRASRALDDVTDTMRDLVRQTAKWEVIPGAWSRDALVGGQASLNALAEAVQVTGEESSRTACLAARFHAGRLRRRYQSGMTRVFSEEFSIETLKRVEVLRRIDDTAVLLIGASDALIDGLVKRYI